MKNWIAGAVLAVCLVPAGAWAETVELVTYYPAPGGGNVSTDRLHADAATIGDDYSLTSPAVLPNGFLLVWDRLGVGLGQNLPAGPLHVVGRNDVTESVLFLPGADTGADGVPGIRVGIGAVNPGSPLHIQANSPGGNPWIGQLLIEPAAGQEDRDASISLRTTYGADRVWTLLAGAGGGSTNFRIFDSTASADRLNIDANGNVGIGTTTPAGPLHVAGKNDAASVAAFMPGTDTAAAGTPEIRVGIGTTAPQATLDVVGDARIREGLKPDYDSGWVADNNATHHNTTFNHNFGNFPSRTEIWFATSSNPTVVYPISWSWIYNYSSNPVTISMTTTQVRFSIVSSAIAHLHGVWDPMTPGTYGDGWTFYSSGYWRVKCWK